MVRQIEDLKAELVADAQRTVRVIEPVPARIFQSDLAILVIDLVDHGHVELQIDRPRLLVERGLEVTLGAELAFGGRENGLLDGLDEDLGLDALVGADLVDDIFQFLWLAHGVLMESAFESMELGNRWTS